MLILPSKIVCWNSCKKSNELHVLVQRSTSPNLRSLQKHCFLHMRFIRSLLKTLLFLYILISLITVIQRCIIISIAIYWKRQEGINVNRSDCARQTCNFHKFLWEAALLTLYNAELTAVGVKAKYATVFLLFTECLQIKYIHYILDWDKIKIYIKAKKKKNNNMIYRAIIQI